MIRRSILRAIVLGVVAAMLLVPVAAADTCCANTAVELDPPSAEPGDVVRLIGLRCLNADNTGPLPLSLGAFWLSSGTRAAEVDPDTVPGPGLPQDLPPTEEWLPFASSPDASATSGRATIVVPDLPRGSYQLWWWCDDGSGPGGAIHYSIGPRLVIGAIPDTATEASDPDRAWGSPGGLGALLIGLGAVAFAGSSRFLARRRALHRATRL